jgi:hypothetical protein
LPLHEYRDVCSAVGIVILKEQDINWPISDLGNLSPLDEHRDVCVLIVTSVASADHLEQNARKCILINNRKEWAIIVFIRSKRFIIRTSSI